MESSVINGINQMLQNMSSTSNEKIIKKKEVVPTKPLILSPIQKKIVESDARSEPTIEVAPGLRPDMCNGE